MSGREERRERGIKRRSALRTHPLTPERKLADQVARGIVPEDGVRVIIDVDKDGNPIYGEAAPADGFVELFMSIPVRSRTRPRTRFGSH